MRSIDGAILDFKRLDLLGAGDTPLHRLDARAKVLVTALFIILVVSHDRYDVAPLIPFFIYPAALLGAGNLPVGFILRKLLLICPFVIIAALFNPLLDRAPAMAIGTISISGGWLSLASIIIRSILTVGSAFTLIALTGFPAVCHALERLGMPRPFATQLLLMYRYIFTLTEEGGRVAKARQLRSFGRKGLGVTSFTPLVGHLLLRTWQRAERVHTAMLSRGFDGNFHRSGRSVFGMEEFVFIGSWTAVLTILRFTDIIKSVSSLITGVMN